MSETILALRRLWIFDEVCAAGGIGQAASVVGLSQPAVSIAMAKLEKAVSAPLFNRGRLGVDLTDQGNLLKRRVTRMITQIEQALVILLNARSPSSLIRTIRRHMTEAQIRCHLAIAEKGSAALAALDLGVSQPAVHRAAREFEQVVGVTLYRRLVHSVSVNAAGREFARRLSLAVNEITQAVEELANYDDGVSGRVEVGVLPLVPQRLMARTIKALLAAHPEATVRLHEASYEELLSRLRFGKLDMIVGALRRPRLQGDVNETDLFKDPQAVVVRREHKLAGCTRITSSDLANFDWIVPNSNMPRRVIIEKMLSSLPTRPRLVVETSSLAMILAMLAESDCITLLPYSQIRHCERSNDLYPLAVDSPEPDRVVGLTTRADWLATPIQKRFIEELKNDCEQTVGQKAE